LVFFIAAVGTTYQQVIKKPNITEPIRIVDPIRVIQIEASPSATLMPSPSVTPETIIKYYPIKIPITVEITSTPKEEKHGRK